MSATDIARIEGKIAERISPQATGQMMVGQTGLAIRDMAQLLEFSKIMAIGGVSVPKHLRGNPGACIAVCLQAIEWQSSPYAVANNSYSVNDRLAYQSAIIHAMLIKRAPIKGRPKFEYLGEGQGRQCKVTAVLDDGTGTVDYTSPPIGKIPVQNSPLWKADPDQQLGYYSVRALARRHFPDVIMGVVEREEAKYTAIAGEYEAVDQPPTKARTGQVGVDQRLAELAANAEPTSDDIIDDETGEILAASGEEPDPAAEEEPPFDDPAQSIEPPDLPPQLLAAARKGVQALKFATGKLTDAQLKELTNDQRQLLNNIAQMSAMKTGE